MLSFITFNLIGSHAINGNDGYAWPKIKETSVLFVRSSLFKIMLFIFLENGLDSKKIDHNRTHRILISYLRAVVQSLIMN